MDRVKRLFRWRRRNVVVPTASVEDPVWYAPMRWLGPLVAASFVAFSPLILVEAALERSAGVAIFAVMWSLFSVIVAHETLATEPTRLQVSGPNLYWSSALRTGALPLDQLRSIEWEGGINRVVSFRTDEDRRLTLRSGPGLRRFCDEVLVHAPTAYHRDKPGFGRASLGEHPDGWSSEPIDATRMEHRRTR